jgi:4-diphosphocytidyl-2-C-methyl-D-erythritol kinase
MNTKKYKSHAKVNLGLKVVNKREDGYHNIDSLFVELDLHDTISFTPSDTFSLSTNFSDLPIDGSNLVTKSYNLLHPHKGKSTTEYSIYIEKKIPMGSGLGGGSSNAATTLKALNQLWGCDYNNKSLCKNGASLGADVPFFINGGIQHVTGIGEVLRPVTFSTMHGLHFLLIVPDIHISTVWAYKALNSSLQSNKSVPNF